jgi:hypothetical protein
MGQLDDPAITACLLLGIIAQSLRRVGGFALHCWAWRFTVASGQIMLPSAPLRGHVVAIPGLPRRAQSGGTELLAVCGRY